MGTHQRWISCCDNTGPQAGLGACYVGGSPRSHTAGLHTLAWVWAGLGLALVSSTWQQELVLRKIRVDHCKGGNPNEAGSSIRCLGEQWMSKVSRRKKRKRTTDATSF